MQPEISHRCASCGASIRDFPEQAMFCPECGNPVPARSPKTEGKKMKTGPPGDPAETSAGTTARTDAAVEASERSAQTANGRKPSRDEQQRARERTREKLQRASTKARGALEDNVKRVEKIHHVSTVMLEEATYDPSLRFVLVAAGLFIMFVILLVLSKVMG
jgi:predicted  nucleic acid-binding Zn-ribbon protein